MIARDSKSYPYLAIAQHCGVPYAEVLQYSDYIKENIYAPTYGVEWREKVWELMQCNIK